jgi:RNA polymerase-binding transcription factor DksA
LAASAPPAVDGAAADHEAVPAPRGHTKDGIAYTKDFDARFLKSQRDLLTAERQSLVGQADRLEDEANSLIEDGEMGDVQFDDESGEGDTMVVERERDLALSAQARQIVADIDAALDRMALGTYGYSLVSGRPIPRERLEAIPWATELVEEKVGGIGRR